MTGGATGGMAGGMTGGMTGGMAGPTGGGGPADGGGSQRPTPGGPPLLEVRGLVKHFPLTQGIVVRRRIGAVRAVDGVDLELRAGETLGVVGESGCGKSTLARVLMNLERPTAGRVLFKGEDISRLRGRALKAVRRNIQMVFQDPYTSLNPRMTVGDIVGEPFEIHPEAAPRGDRRRRVRELLEVVGLDPDHLGRYPHQFSGGQRQRIGIARGLALNPEVIICDEPVSALDVSVQAQVVNLMRRLQERFGLAYLFIAHDLSVVRHVCDRVAVMYLGRIVETGDEERIYQHPTHPYTRALLSAVPVPDPRGRERRERIILAGDVPSPAAIPSGCRFRTRCPQAAEVCALREPELVVPSALRGTGRPEEHPSACHFAADPPPPPGAPGGAATGRPAAGPADGRESGGQTDGPEDGPEDGTEDGRGGAARRAVAGPGALAPPDPPGGPAGWQAP